MTGSVRLVADSTYVWHCRMDGASLRASVDAFLTFLGSLQVNVMAYDYSGYGISEGEPSEEACFADIEAAFAYLVNVKKTPASKIILYVPLADACCMDYFAVHSLKWVAYAAAMGGPWARVRLRISQ